MQWSRLRSKAKELVAESIRKRVDFHTTSYASIHRYLDWNSRAWITIDGKEVLNLAAMYSCDCPYCSIESEVDSIFGQKRLTNGLVAWTSGTAEQALGHDDALIRALAILDRRVGKRRLLAMDLRHAPPLSRLFYLVRSESEGLQPPDYLAGQAETLAATLRRRRLVSKKRSGPNPGQARSAKRQAADSRLVAAGKDNLRRLVDRIAAGETVEARSATGLAVATAVAQSGADRDGLLRLLRHVEKGAEFLEHAGTAAAVCALAQQSARWVRQPEDWKPPGKNASRQFASLARWLWAAFEVPELFDQVWYQEDQRARGWYRHLGSGGSLTTAPELPCPLTKRMAHHVLLAPKDLSLGGAIRWGQTIALGGDRRLADAVAVTRMQREFSDNPFWLSVLRFFVRNPMLDSVHVGPIVDYVHAQRFEPQRHFQNGGEPILEPPRQPCLSMAGRQVGPLLRDVERWHTDLRRSGNVPPISWDASGIAPLSWREGSSKPAVLWVFRELLSSEELLYEGRRMEHCVASYARSCAEGNASIWSLERRVEGQDPEPRLTIEVALPKRSIGQARGQLNRWPSDQELQVVRRWAQQSGLDDSRLRP